MYSHSHTHAYTHFFSPHHPLVTEYALCSCSLRGALGSWVSGALGTDMNKWTVLHSSDEEGSQTPQAGDLNIHYQRAFWKGFSYDYDTFEVVVTRMHVTAHMYLQNHVVNVCTEMHHPALYTHTDIDTFLSVSDPAKKSLPSIQITANHMDRTKGLGEILKRGISEQEINIWFKYCCFLESAVLYA